MVAPGVWRSAKKTPLPVFDILFLVYGYQNVVAGK